MVWLVVIVGAIAAGLVVVWFALTKNHPERADRHAGDKPDVDAMGRGTRSPGIVDRPAGPDAESMAPDPHPRPSPPGPPEEPTREPPG